MATMRGDIRRWTLRIVLLLILGAATTVAVAWGCAALSRPIASWEASGEIMRDEVLAEWYVARGVGNVWLVTDKMRSRVKRKREPWPTFDKGDEPDEPEASQPPHLPAPLRQALHPSNALLTSPIGNPEIIEWNSVGATGLPLLALWYEDGYILGPALAGSTNLIDTGTRGALEVGLDEWSMAFPRVLPLRPMWPGFLLDTLFYAAIWFGIFFGFASARRALRRRRGRCPKCNYDLRGELDTGCPECGWNRSEPRP